jgi:single-strand DNA-binding protein
LPETPGILLTDFKFLIGVRKMARSLNKVQLIGNLTRDPELRYTPQCTAVCTFGLATNRGWTTDSGEKKEDTEFHRIVAWNKLAELCSQLLSKGRKVYVEGRLSTRNWTGQDGQQKYITEVVASDMLVLDSRRSGEREEQAGSDVESNLSQDMQDIPSENTHKDPQKTKSTPSQKSPKEEIQDSVNPDDIPF